MLRRTRERLAAAINGSLAAAESVSATAVATTAAAAVGGIANNVINVIGAAARARNPYGFTEPPAKTNATTAGRECGNGSRKRPATNKGRDDDTEDESDWDASDVPDKELQRQQQSRKSILSNTAGNKRSALLVAEDDIPE